jgi:hypothetical protein
MNKIVISLIAIVTLASTPLFAGFGKGLAIGTGAVVGASILGSALAPRDRVYVDEYYYDDRDLQDENAALREENEKLRSDNK